MTFWNWLKSLFVHPPVALPTQQPIPAPAPVPDPAPAPAPKQPPAPSKPKPPAPGPVASSKIAAKLSWEKYPENKPWSDYLFNLITEKYLAVFDTATDIEKFRPEYHSLNAAQRATVVCEIISGTALYECGWNPKSYSVDVGSKDNKDTWSVGLLQLSVVDQENYGFKFGYSFSDLQDAYKNLILGMAIMSKQIQKHGVIAIPSGGSGLYWATLHPGGKYDKTEQIAAMVQKLKL